MVYDLTLDPRSQLQAGLLVYLWPILPNLLPSREALRTGWPDAELSQAVATGTFSPIVSIWVGDYTPTRQQPGTTSVRTVQGPVTDLSVQTEVVTLTEVVRIQAPVTLVIMAGGVRGRPICGAVATALVGLLGRTVDIPLPDSYETEDTVDPTLTTFGLHARLTYLGESEVHDKNGVRDLHRYDVRYRAEQSRYVAQTDPVITGVHTGLTLIDQANTSTSTIIR